MRSVFLILIISLSIPSIAFCAPNWQSRVDLREPGIHPSIRPSTLDFTLSWKGMVRAGTLRIEFAPRDAQKPKSFVTRSSASSLGAAALLFPYQTSFWSECDPTSLLPKYFQSTETDDEETVVTTNRYTPGSVSVAENVTRTADGNRTAESFVFPYGPAYDLFSAILTVRSMKLDRGDSHTMLILPFKSPYLLHVVVEAKEKHMGQDAIRLQFSLRKIDRATNTLIDYKKLKRPVTLWLSDNADRIPLEIRAAVYIGDVRAVLTSFKTEQ